MRSLQLGAKWLADRILAAVGLVVLAPVFGAIWVWVRRDAGAPVFISQDRAGQGGRAVPAAEGAIHGSERRPGRPGPRAYG